MAAHDKNIRSPAASVIEESSHRRVVEREESNRLKISLPDLYNGSPGKYKDYILQCEIYLTVKNPPNGTPHRVMWAMGFLRGDAAVWAQGVLADHLENGESERKAATRAGSSQRSRG